MPAARRRARTSRACRCRCRPRPAPATRRSARRATPPTCPRTPRTRARRTPTPPRSRPARRSSTPRRAPRRRRAPARPARGRPSAELDRGQPVERRGVLLALVVEQGVLAADAQLLLRPCVVVGPLALVAHQRNAVAARVGDPLDV